MCGRETEKESAEGRGSKGEREQEGRRERAGGKERESRREGRGERTVTERTRKIKSEKQRGKESKR